MLEIRLTVRLDHRDELWVEEDTGANVLYVCLFTQIGMDDIYLISRPGACTRAALARCIFGWESEIDLAASTLTNTQDW